ncbi:MAG: hypothetical protein JF886_13020 [Candidatus Dormibacteraeota bacterium]|uniref:Uncharacterized protein n=1 Tax=Candidatus Aeolococcus gillhamiae TaxID=3127015 RepID=A0A2W5ZAY4_9BACT|nr:hypothetical protein [Candidatus Dormibacteraeota bacterium]PZR82569.1 MAG: hypothetical protein DLM65_03545 [Candidatus Dormibacter sp. RRmetagenome_bin12]
MRPVSKQSGRRTVIAALVASVVALLSVPAALAAGSATLYPNGVAGTRANTEWRTSTYGGGAVFRRTLLHAYATAGEYLLMGSTAIGVGAADVMVWDPGLVAGTVGLESVPTTTSYSCAAQRSTSGVAAQGKIVSRGEELAGPDTVPSSVPNGYTPCYYQVPSTGIYSIAMIGPSGPSSDADGGVAADVGLASASDFNASQLTSVAGWDVTVRDSLADATTTRPGRLYTFTLALFTGGNGRPADLINYVVTPDGYRYKVDDHGMDPNGWIQYANRLGFLDPDGKTPLYHDAVAVNSGHPAQLTSIQGGVIFARPEFPMFFEPPAPAALTALGIPLAPTAPQVSSLTFRGIKRPAVASPQSGGSFSFTSSVTGVYQIVISHDGVNFDPTNPQNRVLRGSAVAGPQKVAWDGKDNSGAYLPIKSAAYPYRVGIHGGEYHLPFVDVENNIQGGPSITLLNPPNGVCPALNGGCSGAFYDDRGYSTTTGQTVGTAGTVLCGLNPPTVAFSDPVLGYDTTSNQRAFGTPVGGNANVPCLGNFGDTKGLDLWTYYAAAPVNGELTVGDQPAPAGSPLSSSDSPSAAAPPATLSTPQTGTALAGPFAGGAVLTILGMGLAAVTGRRRTAIQAPRTPTSVTRPGR